MEVAQTINGALDAGYTLNGAFIIIGALLVMICSIIGYVFVTSVRDIKDQFKNEVVAIHNRIDRTNKTQEQLLKSHLEVREKVIHLETNHFKDIEKTCEIMVTKLRAAGGL